MVYFIDHILDHIDRKMTTGAAFIDLRKAFELIGHEYFLCKPEHYGMRGSSLDRFRNYLTPDTNTEAKFWKSLVL